VLLAAIADRLPEESPGEALRRAVQEHATHRRPSLPRREAAELSTAARLALTTPALQAKWMFLLLDAQRQVVAALLKAFPDELDPITAAAMAGSVFGAIQQASLTSAHLGQSQKQLWEAATHALDIATDGLLSVRRQSTGRQRTKGRI
jgi:hypothetical protein